MPFSAASWPMPPPMAPAPRTARRVDRASAFGVSPPLPFEPSMSWKTWIRFFATSEVASVPAARASASKPACIPSSMPVRMTSIARIGAG